jgi:hypothetical protein
VIDMGTYAADSKQMPLNTWKEIATYMGRGVRTVQRYERDLHLPVRRISGKPHSSVIALRNDLDLWLKNRVERPVCVDRVRTKETFLAVHESMTQFIELRAKNHILRRQYKDALDGLVASIRAASMAFGTTKK